MDCEVRNLPEFRNFARSDYAESTSSLSGSGQGNFGVEEFLNARFGTYKNSVSLGIQVCQ